MDTIIQSQDCRIWTTSNGAGIPCILCNGGPGCDDYLQPVSAMIEDICQVVRFEPRGCGRSDWDQNYDLMTTIADIEAIRLHYGFDKIILGGHSAGPDVALAYTMTYPENVIAVVGIAGGRMTNDRDWAITYKENLHTIGEDNGGHCWQADPLVNKIGNATWKDYIKREYLLRDLAALSCPVTFINAECDIRPNWPTKQLAALIPHASYQEIQGAAHSIWLTHAVELREKIRAFINSLPLSS